jgi:hypothetical protein
VISEKRASYTPDIAAEIDTEEEILADEYRVSLTTARQILADRNKNQRCGQALILGQVIGLLLRSGNNLPVMVHALAMAAGLDQLNGAHSEAEIARRYGVSRALLSHYVVGWRDLLSGKQYSFDITKFRKSNNSRVIYAEKAKNPHLTARAGAIQRRKNTTLSISNNKTT